MLDEIITGAIIFLPVLSVAIALTGLIVTCVYIQLWVFDINKTSGVILGLSEIMVAFLVISYIIGVAS